jgi:hypothetical protein
MLDHTSHSLFFCRRAAIWGAEAISKFPRLQLTILWSCCLLEGALCRLEEIAIFEEQEDEWENDATNHY